MTICCVIGCGKQQFPGCGLHFHRIPENPEIRQKWIEAIPVNGKLTKNSTVCSSHFENDDYISLVSNDQNVRVLKPGVIPSIFTEVESIEEDELDTDNVITINQNKPSHSTRPTNVLVENKIDNRKLARPTTEGNKIMIVNPISTVNKIEDVITIKTQACNEDRQSSSEGISVVNQVNGILNNYLTQKNIKKIIVVKPITENERIAEATKNITNSNSSDISSGNVSSESENLSDDEKDFPFCCDEININVAAPKRTLKRKHNQETPVDVHGSKVPCNSKFQCTKTNITHDKSRKLMKCHMSTQTGPFTNTIEQELKKKIQVIKQKLHRRNIAFKQMNIILDLIKNKCKNYAEVKEVLSLKLKQLPENLNCDGVIIAP